MAQALTASMSRPAYWKSYLSEAESNYGSAISRQARAWPPHRWRPIPVRVVTAAIASLGDADLAAAYGVAPGDPAARANRHRAEDRQARVCEFAADCRVERVLTADHYVQNAAPERVAAAIEGLANAARRLR